MDTLKIALLGYGKMGRLIEKLAIEQGHEIVFKSNSTSSPEEWTKLEAADVAIEFSSPDAVLNHLKNTMQRGVPVVCGTTGWLSELDTAKQWCTAYNSALFYASNFSLGVNIFFALNRFLAEKMAQFSTYQVALTEIHHVHKKDAPSGTAISLAEDLLSLLPEKDQWSLSSNADPNTIPIHSVREGEVPGTHEVVYRSAIDTLSIKHEAHSRAGFVQGAIEAAKWLIGKKGYFEMKDML
ncbi:MAG TPA: 4-hydroxy-tetrahydrodipicolinate reductase [Saprospiraceae bacterium]|nr:4-hydroxy-tetrahydrodipicolinate reductase [Saprospiraceae bacterium]HMQ81253.1 4-hydroxy-tetrahydrodipicolinate reductase [Saprospiraceae bacterium]